MPSFVIKHPKVSSSTAASFFRRRFAGTAVTCRRRRSIGAPAYLELTWVCGPCESTVLDWYNDYAQFLCASGSEGPALTERTHDEG